jgi:3-methyladenine DNA glycosylase/8-oxoguanine DNA glycosylase
MPIPLDHTYEISLSPTAPFNFDATLHKPDHFPSGDNTWLPGVRWQTMLWHGTPLGLKFENQGSLNAPAIRLSVYSTTELTQPFLDSLTRELIYRYNLHMHLSGFYDHFLHDPLLGPVIQRWQGLRPMNVGSLYEYLMIAIVLQNATVRRSVSMLQALFETYGNPLTFDGKTLYSYWTPEAMSAASEQDLRALKVGYRAKSIQRVTTAFVRAGMDELSLRFAPLEEQRQSLLNLYGIGPASVGYILFDVFHQLDDLRYISPWEQKIYSRMFFAIETDAPLPVARLLQYFEQRFNGYRMLAIHYLWEDLFWKQKNEPDEWLEKLIRL